MHSLLSCFSSLCLKCRIRDFVTVIVVVFVQLCICLCYPYCGSKLYM